MEDKIYQTGHRFVPFSPEEAKKFTNFFPKLLKNERQVGRLTPGNWLAWEALIENLDNCANFKTYSDDVVIMSFPKCGTMWLSEIVWTMRNFSLVKTEAANQSVFVKTPAFIGDCVWNMERPVLTDFYRKIYPELDSNRPPMIQAAEMTPRPRTLRSHLPFSLSPPTMLDDSKTIFIARNPKDVCISAFHFFSLLKSFQFDGDLDDCIDVFIEDKVVFSPFFEFNRDVSKRLGHPNLHFIFFENLKKDPLKEIQRLNEFLGTKLNSAQLEEVIEFTSFENMKKRDAVYGAFKSKDGSENGITTRDSKQFFRKGLSGGWKNVLTEEQNRKLDQWIERESKDLDFQFIYE